MKRRMSETGPKADLTALKSDFRLTSKSRYHLRDRTCQPRNDESSSSIRFGALRRLRSLERQNEVVGRHPGDLDQRHPVARRQLLECFDIAHPPFGIAVAKAA